MHFIKALVQNITTLLSRLSSSQKPNALENSILRKLPTEVLQNEEAKVRIENGSLFTYKRISFHGKCTFVEQHSGLYKLWPYRICPHVALESTEGYSDLHVQTTYRVPVQEKWSMKQHCDGYVTIKEMPWKSAPDLSNATIVGPNIRSNSSTVIGVLYS